jgi:diacylglycerol kinase family enzyme
MRLLLVVNASASSVTARTRVVIQTALGANHDLSVAETSRRGHATRLAQGAAAEGVDAVIVLGGDGTLNEAANGLAGATTALGVLPGGSTNVFARTIGTTNDPVEATVQILAALAHNNVRQISLGQVNGRYFLFHVGLGFDAAVVAQVERRPALKRHLGPAVFVYAAFDTWLRHYDRSHVAYRAEITEIAGGRRSIEQGYFGVGLKTNPYTFLGARPLDLAPGTGFDTGLTLVSFRNLRLATILPVAIAALRGGAGVAASRGVDVAPGVARAVIEGVRPLPYQVDGDYLGEAERLELAYVPDGLRLIIPERAAPDRARRRPTP